MGITQNKTSEIDKLYRLSLKYRNSASCNQNLDIAIEHLSNGL